MAGKKLSKPYRDDAGYVASRVVRRPIGGWLVVYDTRQTADWLEVDEASEGRWAVWHDKTGATVLAPSQRAARDIMEAVSVDGGSFLAEEEAKLAKPKRAAAAAVPAKDEIIRLEPGNPDNAREIEEAELCDTRTLNANLTLSLARRFPMEALMDKLEAGLEAMRPSFGDGPALVDFPTRLKYLETIFRYQVGQPQQRQEIAFKRDTTIEDLRAMAQGSDIFREALRGILEGCEKRVEGKEIA